MLISKQNLYPSGTTPTRKQVTKGIEGPQQIYGYFTKCANIKPNYPIRAEDDKTAVTGVPLHLAEALRYFDSYNLNQRVLILTGAVNVAMWLDHNKANSYNHRTFSPTTAWVNLVTFIQSDRGLARYCTLVMPQLDSAAPEILAKISAQFIKLKKLNIQTEQPACVEFIEKLCHRLQVLADSCTGEKRDNILKRIHGLRGEIPPATTAERPDETASRPITADQSAQNG